MICQLAIITSKKNIFVKAQKFFSVSQTASYDDTDYLVGVDQTIYNADALGRHFFVSYQWLKRHEPVIRDDG